MDRGYLIIAQNSYRKLKDDSLELVTDYVRHAYALALSIKATQRINNVSILTDTDIPDNYKHVFDEVIEIPWGDLAENTLDGKFHNEWKVAHITPYDETIKIEADMLLPASIDHWWELLSVHDLLFTTNVYNYRNEVITSRACRKIFDNNELPDIYNGFMYFKRKNKNTNEFFKMAECVMKDWENMYYEFLDYTRPTKLDTDTAYALALKLIGKEDIYCNKSLDYPKFVHMKKELMNWNLNYTKEWYNTLPVVFDNNNMYVGGYKQTLPFHYHNKEFLTDIIIRQYEV